MPATPETGNDAVQPGTVAVPERHRVDADALSAWLREHVPGFAGPPPSMPDRCRSSLAYLFGELQ